MSQRPSSTRRTRAPLAIALPDIGVSLADAIIERSATPHRTGAGGPAGCRRAGPSSEPVAPASPAVSRCARGGSSRPPPRRRRLLHPNGTGRPATVTRREQRPRRPHRGRGVRRRHPRAARGRIEHHDRDRARRSPIHRIRGAPSVSASPAATTASTPATASTARTSSRSAPGTGWRGSSVDPTSSACVPTSRHRPTRTGWPTPWPSRSAAAASATGPSAAVSTAPEGADTRHRGPAPSGAADPGRSHDHERPRGDARLRRPGGRARQGPRLDGRGLSGIADRHGRV